jgi:hypothetical protein
VIKEVAVRHFDRVDHDAPHTFPGGGVTAMTDAPWRRWLALLGMTVVAIGVLLGLGITVHTNGHAGEISCGPAWTGTSPHGGVDELTADDEATCDQARQARGGTALILLVLGGTMTAIAVTGRRRPADSADTA